MTRAIAIFFGAGLLPGAPGTWGSLVAVPLAWGLHFLGGFPALLAATPLLFGLGLWAVAVESKSSDDHDPAEFVVDEVVGQWIALFPLSAGLWLADTPAGVFPWPGWVLGFLAFRFFDIIKPWPVRWADNMETPLGLMLDDVLAGIMAAGVVLIAASLAHGLL